MPGPQMVIRIAATVQELKANLAEGVSQIETTTGALVRMAASYDGSKVITQASATAAAIGHVGNVTTLTASEQAKANAVLEAALEKYKALGREAPPGMQALADATRQHPSLLERVKESLGPLGPAFAAAFSAAAVYLSVNAIKSAITSTVDYAKHLDDLSQESGLTTDALQALGAKGAEVGLDMDSIALATTQLARRLASGDESAQAAVDRLGLSYKALRAQSPDQQMLAIANALTQLTDSGHQAELAFDLFGKGGVKLLGIIRDNQGGLDGLVQQMKDAGLVIGSDTVKRLDAQGDAWTRLGTRLRVASAGFLDWATSTEKDTEQLAKLGFVIDAHGNLVKKAAEETHALVVQTNAHRTAADEVAARIHALTNDALAPLSQAQRSQIDDLIKWGVNEKEVAQLVGTTTAAVHLQVQAHKDKQEAMKKAAAEAEAAAKVEAQGLLQTTKLWDEYFALRIKHGGTAMDSQIADIERGYADQVAAAKKAGTDSADYYKALEAMSGEASRSVMVDWAAVGNSSTRNLQQTADKAQATYDYMVAHSNDFRRETIQHFKDVATEAQWAANGWSDSFGKALDETAAKAAKAQKALEDAADAAAKANRALGNSVTYDLSTAEGMAYFKQLNPSATVNADTNYFKTHSLQQAIQAGLVNVYGGFAAAGAAPHLAEGGTLATAGRVLVGDGGPELLDLPRGASVVPLSRAADGGGTSVVFAPGSVVVQNPVMDDPRAMRNIQRLLSKAVMDAMRAQGYRARVAS